MSYEEFNRPPVAEVPFSASLSLHLLSSRQEVVPLSPRRASRIYPAWLRTPHRRPNNARFVSVRSAFYPGRVFFESVLPACRFPFFIFFTPLPQSLMALPLLFFDATLSSTAFYRPLSVFSSSSCRAKQVAQQVETLQLYFPLYSDCCCCCCFIYHNVDSVENIICSLLTIFLPSSHLNFNNSKFQICWIIVFLGIEGINLIIPFFVTQNILFPSYLQMHICKCTNQKQRWI